jgi:biotin carboxyl carrier protein
VTTATATPATPTATSANDAPFVEVTSENHAEVLRSAYRGRVQAIPAAVGARVKVGDVVVVLAEEAGNAADIATRRESISALEGIADGNEAASRQLAVEKSELKALLSKAPQKKLLSPVAGMLAALDVKVGESVRQAQVIGRIQGDDVVVRARVAADVAAGVPAGATCELKTKSSALAKGTLKEKVDRGAGQFELVVDAGQNTDVTGLRCLPAP